MSSVPMLPPAQPVAVQQVARPLGLEGKPTERSCAAPSAASLGPPVFTEHVPRVFTNYRYLSDGRPLISAFEFQGTHKASFQPL